MKKMAFISSVLLLCAVLSSVQLLNAQEPSSAPSQSAMKAADTKTSEEPASSAAKQEEIWFVNDKVGETKEILERFPDIKAVLKISENFEMSEYENSGLPYFKTLLEIKDHIEQYG